MQGWSQKSHQHPKFIQHFACFARGFLRVQKPEAAKPPMCRKPREEASMTFILRLCLAYNSWLGRWNHNRTGLCLVAFYTQIATTACTLDSHACKQTLKKESLQAPERCNLAALFGFCFQNMPNNYRKQRKAKRNEGGVLFDFWKLEARDEAQGNGRVLSGKSKKSESRKKISRIGVNWVNWS